jgi:hypothetical protein
MRLDTAAMIALNIFPDSRQRPDFSELRILIALFSKGSKLKQSYVRKTKCVFNDIDDSTMEWFQSYCIK